MAPPGIGHKAPMNVARLSGGTTAAAALAMTPRALLSVGSSHGG